MSRVCSPRRAVTAVAGTDDGLRLPGAGRARTRWRAPVPRPAVPCHEASGGSARSTSWRSTGRLPSVTSHRSVAAPGWLAGAAEDDQLAPGDARHPRRGRRCSAASMRLPARRRAAPGSAAAWRPRRRVRACMQRAAAARPARCSRRGRLQRRARAGREVRSRRRSSPASGPAAVPTRHSAHVEACSAHVRRSVSGGSQSPGRPAAPPGPTTAEVSALIRARPARAGPSRRPRVAPGSSVSEVNSVGPPAADRGRVAVHHLQVGADQRREVGLVDHEQVGAGDAGAALARHLVAAGDVDHEDLPVRRGRRRTSR